MNLLIKIFRQQKIIVKIQGVLTQHPGVIWRPTVGVDGTLAIYPFVLVTVTMTVIHTVIKLKVF